MTPKPSITKGATYMFSKVMLALMSVTPKVGLMENGNMQRLKEIVPGRDTKDPNPYATAMFSNWMFVAP